MEHDYVEITEQMGRRLTALFEVNRITPIGFIRKYGGNMPPPTHRWEPELNAKEIRKWMDGYGRARRQDLDFIKEILGDEDFIEITEETCVRLNTLFKARSLTPEKFIRKHPHRPINLTIRSLKFMLAAGGLTKKEIADFVSKSLEDYTPGVAVTDADRQQIKRLMVKRGFKSASWIDSCPNRPAGLTKNVFRSLLNGSTHSIPSNWLDFILNTLIGLETEQTQKNDPYFEAIVTALQTPSMHTKSFLLAVYEIVKKCDKDTVRNQRWANSLVSKLIELHACGKIDIFLQCAEFCYEETNRALDAENALAPSSLATLRAAKQIERSRRTLNDSERFDDLCERSYDVLLVP